MNNEAFEAGEPKITRRQLIADAGAIIGGLALLNVIAVTGGIQARRWNWDEGDAGLGEWAKSILVRMRGGGMIEKGQSLMVFPDAVVTGDISQYILPILTYDVNSLTRQYPDLGTLLIVNNRTRIAAPYGAYVDYRPSDISEKDFLQKKLERMTQIDNCIDGCKAIVIARYSDRDGIKTIGPEGLYIAGDKKIVPLDDKPKGTLL